MLTVIERVIYFFLFLLNKYINLNIIENWLNKYENKIIKKYVSKKEIPSNHIPTIYADELTNEKFVKLSNNFRSPVLIKNYMKDTDAVKKWDIPYLKDIIGDFHLNILSNETDLKIKNYTFNKFAEEVKDNSIYINNNHTIMSHFPSLFNDIKEKFNSFVNTIHSTNLRNIHIANFFIGYNKNNKVTGSNMHCGGSGNFFCMIKGTKHWTLISPEYSCILKGRVSQTGIHGQTLFDMVDTSLEETPEIFKYLPRYEVVLEPGDILWNAPWWWHRIKNGPELSIGLAIRNNKVTKINLLNNPTFTLSGYVYLLYNSVFIDLYEKIVLSKNKHFGKSKEETKKSNVLYQIEKLIKKYPKSTNINTII